MLNQTSITDKEPSGGDDDTAAARALLDPRSGHKCGSRLI
jgi:hypothetical protein